MGWLFLLFAAAEEFLEEVAFLGWCVGVGGAFVGVGLGCGVGLALGMAVVAEEFVDEGLGAFAHLGAGVLGLGAVEEGEVVVDGAGGVGDEIGGAIEADGGDTFGGGEGLHVGVLGELDSALHEVGPDRCGGVGTLQFVGEGGGDVGVVVVADPDDAEEVGGVAGEPDVVGGAGFAGGGGGEAEGADGGAGATGEDAFHEGLGEVGGAGVEDLFAFWSEVGDDVTLVVADGGEHPGGETDAAVGEDGVGAGHVDGRGAVGADGHRGGCTDIGDAGGAGERGYIFIAHLLGEGDGGDVERVLDGGGGSDHAGVLAAFEVAGGVGLAVGAEVLRVVVELGDGGEDAAIAEGRAVEGAVVGGGVDEGFEDGAGGALGDGVVELRGAVVTAADEGEDLAGVGVEGDEGGLGVVDGAAVFAVELANELIDVDHAFLDGGGGGALQLGVKRGVDA